MSEVAARVAGLSPEKRSLLMQRLRATSPANPSESAIRLREQRTAWPMSSAQQRLWFLDQLQPGTPLYNIPAAIRLQGPLDLGALERSLNEIVRRHEVLRSAFKSEAGQPVQVLVPGLWLDIPLVDLRGLPPEQRESGAMSLATAEACQPFDLSQGPLLRSRLLRLAEQDYVLLLTLHHICYDAWSSTVLLRELADLYEAYTTGRPSPLAELPLQYADYAAWQQAWLNSPVFTEQLAYWREQLSGPLPGMVLPGRHPVGRETGRGAHFRFSFPTELAAGLRDLGRQEKATLFMTLLAAFQALLYRYTGQEAICVGTPGANRDHVETHGMIGFFVNTLVIRTDCSAEPCFRELLRRVRRVVLEALAHQDLPFDRLVQDLQPERSLDHNPLVQVMFELEDDPASALCLAGLSAHLLPVETGTAKFDLTLTVTDTAGALQGTLEYNSDMFEPATVARLAGHWRTLLEAIVAEPNRSISTLPMLTAAERQQLLLDWPRATLADYPTDHCIHDLVARQAAQSPQALAVASNGMWLSFSELNQRANQLAHYLCSRGAGPDQLVGLCVEPSWQMIVGALGILKAGAAYVPLDASYPPERLAYMLKDSQPVAVVTQDRLRQKLGAPSMPLVYIDGDWPLIGREADVDPASTATTGNLAYVIYTSGSTGKPKGVQIEHGALLNLVSWHRRAFAVSERDRATQIAGPGFDAAVWEIWPYLASGASVHFPPAEIRTAPEQLRDWLVAQRITISFLPTPLAEGVLGLTWPAGTALRVLLTGGDRLTLCPPPALPFKFVNNYGPTESTVVTTSGLVTSAADEDMAPPIGSPIANTQVYLLDSHLQAVPVGVPGELYIGGLGLARGYLNRPELTAEKFIPNPLAALLAGAPGPVGASPLLPAGSRLYKTGDLAVYRPDGLIEFLGRIDQQVKIRGNRIELGEIATVLGQHPAVQQAVVVVREDIPGGRGLVAYLVPADGTALEVDELRGFLRRTLPEYMLPAAFVCLAHLPLTANGKVDRGALPRPPDGGLMQSQACSSPSNPLEEVVAEVFAEVLGLACVSIHDHFFELGGHSLLATQVISRLRTAFGVELPLRTLFEKPTVAGMAAKVAAALQTAGGVLAPPVQSVPRDGRIPLSFAQQRLWFLSQLEPGDPSYNIAIAVRLHGRLDAAALEQSLNDIIRRHETLRTIFPTLDGQASQQVLPDLCLALPLADLQYLAEPAREAEALRLAAREARRPFDLSQGPLLRAVLIRLGLDHHILCLTVHHIVSDGWSMGVLVQELVVSYEAHVTGAPAQLPPLAVQYADFAAWQRDWLQGEVLQAQLDYWQRQLSGELPVLHLHTDRPRPSVQTDNGARLACNLPADLTADLQSLSHRHEVTLFMTLLAAFQTLLYRYTGQEDICVGTPIANRNRAEIEGLIGFFVNTLVLRSQLAGDPSFAELLSRVKEVALGAYCHQDLPFEKLVEVLQPERSLSRSPLFQVMFVLQNAPAPVPQLSGLTVSPVDVDTGTATFDLTLTVEQRADGLACALEYNTDLFDATTAASLLRHFQTLLASIVADPGRRVSELAMLDEAERRQILFEWNDTAQAWPLNPCIHELFETQASITPAAPALTSAGETWTYAELNQRSNQLARHLRALGVRSETLVGLCADRSLEMIVGLLGILKAGAAYVPLDPDYPAERLAFIAGDAKLSALVAQSRFADRLPMPEERTVCLDRDWPVIELQDGSNLACAVSPDNLAYVIYTSGTTGQAKGVMVSHSSVVNHGRAVTQPFGLQASDRVLQFATINFDTAVEEIFPTWFNGGTVVLRPKEIPTGRELVELVRGEGVTVLDLPTAYWHEWVFEQAFAPEALPSCLRLVIVGGEKAWAEHYGLWQNVGGAAVVWLNTYGPTEGTIIASLYRPGPEAGLATELPIGRPIANVQLYVLDRRLQPVPIGVPGDLYIGGAGVARGYIGRPELTAQAFVPNPFAAGPVGPGFPSRLYKTGDRARYLPDGQIQFLGRSDDQVKIRGFRIEPGEIESILRRHANVREAVVIAREGKHGVLSLVAYIVPANATSCTAEGLRDCLKLHLPEYMLPAAIVILAELPLAPNGKVDRKALPAPELAGEHFDKVAEATDSPAERILANIWAQVLGLPHVDINADFFALGGDSILSIQMIARANQAGLSLSPKQLFEHPTVARLAAVAGDAKPRRMRCEQGFVQGPVPLNPMQSWFFEQEVSEPQHWNQAVLLTPRRPLDRKLLTLALQELMNHHDALRLRFERLESGWQQRNAGPVAEVPLAWISLGDLPAAAQNRALQTRAAQLQASLDLAHGPIWRAAYFDLGPDQPGRLLLVIHHLAVDGVSWRILLDDLNAVYEQVSHGLAASLPAKTTAFQYWAQRLADHAGSAEVRRQAAYWCAVPSGPFHPLPVDWPADANLEGAAETVTTELGTAETTALLQEVPEAYGTEINDVLLTALVAAMAGWTGQRKLLISLEGHGRADIFEDVDLTRTVGWFTTAFPVELDLTHARGPGSALKTVKEQLRLIPGQGLGYGLLRYLGSDAPIVERLRALPQPEIAFNYLGQVDQFLEGMGNFEAAEEIGPVRSPKGRRGHLLELSAVVIRGCLRVQWTYAGNIYRRTTIEALAQSFIRELTALIAHCQGPEAGGYTPSDFSEALSEDEIEALLNEIK